MGLMVVIEIGFCHYTLCRHCHYVMGLIIVIERGFCHYTLCRHYVMGLIIAIVEFCHYEYARIVLKQYLPTENSAVVTTYSFALQRESCERTFLISLLFLCTFWMGQFVASFLINGTTFRTFLNGNFYRILLISELFLHIFEWDNLLHFFNGTIVCTFWMGQFLAHFWMGQFLHIF